MNALVEPSRGLIELYRNAGVLNAEIERLERLGAQTVRVDAGSWDGDSFLTALAHALDFPDYFGGNLDALADALGGSVAGEYGYRDVPGCRLLAIYQFDSFVRSAPRRSAALLEVLHDTAILALKLGDPFLALLQSDDPDLSLQNVGGRTIAWNHAEFLRSKRSVTPPNE